MSDNIKYEYLYAVKFDKGYYAEKQTNYEWSFTDDISKAKLYKNHDTAKERGEWGVTLNSNPCSAYEIVKCERKTVLTVLEKV